MSKIQKLPQNVLDSITPYLLSGEVVEKALLQDNKKPREIWLIKTNQAIILHGRQPDKPQPAIMVLALDEIREIDYFIKVDDIQIIFYSSKNNGKAVFHFEPSAEKELEKFFLDLGDLITFRYSSARGKIVVKQKALPIGDKDRKVFGRGKTQEAAFLTKSKIIRNNTETTNNKPSEKATINSDKKPSLVQAKPVVSTPQKIESNEVKKATEKPVEISKTKSETKEQPRVEKKPDIPVQKTIEKVKIEEKKDKAVIEKPVTEKKEERKEEPSKEPIIKKSTVETNNSEKSSKNSISTNSETKLKTEVAKQQEKPVKATNTNKTQVETPSKPKKEIDFGNPVYIIVITVLATILGFFCLSFFRMISKVTKYFRKG